MEKSGHNVSQDLKGVNGSDAHSQHRVIRAASLMGFWTFLSRILGMLRDVVSARSFGTSWQWDAFIYAFMIPNFFRRLVGEGALSSAFIPVYSETLAQKGREEAFRFANVVLTTVASGLLLFLLVMEVALNVILRFTTLPPVLNLTVDLLRILFPYLWFVSLFALGMGISHSHRHFFIPSLGPVILNTAWIAGVLWIIPNAGPELASQTRWLAVILLWAGAVQLFVEIPALYRLGFRIRWVWDLLSAELIKTGKLLLPSILGFAVVQINIMVDMTLALAIGPGANSSLWYGTRLMQFPLGIFAIAMGTALLPAISHHMAKNEIDQVRRTMSFSLRAIFLIILPSSVGLMVLGKPIVQILFERGEFDALSTVRTATVLLCYAVGLFAYSGQKIFAAGFHAVQDTRTPVQIGVVALISNVVLNLILMVPLREAGLALATSLSGILQFVLLLIIYQKRIARLDTRILVLSFVKILFAAAAMGALCVGAFHFLSGWFSAYHLLSRALHILSAVLVSIAGYFVFCFCFRVSEVKEVLHGLRRRPSKEV